MTQRAETVMLRAGICRFCGCTETTACQIDLDDEIISCSWADAYGTLCTNPHCLAQVSTEEILQLAMGASHAKRKAVGR